MIIGQQLNEYCCHDENFIRKYILPTIKMLIISLMIIMLAMLLSVFIRLYFIK